MTADMPEQALSRPDNAGREYRSMSLLGTAELQRILDQHTIAGDGRCLACHGMGPCGTRSEALSVIATREELPNRRPGASRPELLGMRRVA